MRTVIPLLSLSFGLFLSACHGLGPVAPVVTPDYILELNTAGAGGGK